MVSCEIIFKGNVQGVGFRYTTIHIARSFSVSGFVKNLPTDDVQVKVEGDENTVKEFINEIQKEMKEYISETEVNWGKYKGEFKDFNIRF